MSDTKFTDSFGDEYRAIKSGIYGEKPIIDLVMNARDTVVFYAEDAEEIIKIIRLAAL